MNRRSGARSSLGTSVTLAVGFPLLVSSSNSAPRFQAMFAGSLSLLLAAVTFRATGRAVAISAYVCLVLLFSTGSSVYGLVGIFTTLASFALVLDVARARRVRTAPILPVAWAMAVLGITIASVSVLQFAAKAPVLAIGHPSANAIGEFYSVPGLPRTMSIFPHANALAAFSLMFLSASLAMGQRFRPLGLARVPLRVASSCFTLTTVMSQSRTGFVALVAVLLLSGVRSAREGRAIRVAVVALLVILPFFFISRLSSGSLGQIRFVNSARFVSRDEGSTIARQASVRAAQAALSERPNGIGFGNSAQVLPAFGSDNSTGTHSLALGILVEGGWFMGLGLLGFLGWVTWRARYSLFFSLLVAWWMIGLTESAYYLPLASGLIVCTLILYFTMGSASDLDAARSRGTVVVPTTPGVGIAHRATPLVQQAGGPHR